MPAAGAGGPRAARTIFARSVCEYLTRAGTPDLYNHVPLRAVTIDEARLHKWPHFWDQVTACSFGHIAARYVSNPGMCVDCNRINSGKAPIYPSTSGDKSPDIPQYVRPIANRNFEWTAEKQEQFFTAYVNTCSVPDALNAVGAQMSHLIQIRKEDSAFRERMNRTEETDIRQAQFWLAEAAVRSNDRMQQLQAQRKFPDSFGSGAQSGLGRQDVGNPEQIDAEFAQLLRGFSVEGKSEGQSSGAIEAGTAPKPESGVGEVGERSDSESLTSGGVFPEDDPNSDLVS